MVSISLSLSPYVLLKPKSIIFIKFVFCSINIFSDLRYAKGTGISWQANLNVAATFNKDLMYEVGKAQGEENKEKGINTFLSPCVNIMRTPQAGRVWEAFGEDPFYSGVCASEMIKGIQDVGVIATIKHFVGNDQETYRHASSSNIDMAPLTLSLKDNIAFINSEK